MFIHTFGVLILLVGLFFLVRWLFRTRGIDQIRSLMSYTSSLEILRQRYAKGEINREEFERMKQDLTGDL
jgi:putative membrane protein